LLDRKFSTAHLQQKNAALNIKKAIISMTQSHR
jgi:hypothetical protein